jgi:hypothetical protein|tara:strand:+ start:543 stop:695 length:153 start_codon:yes stop_codon:yes gene_type:complete
MTAVKMMFAGVGAAVGVVTIVALTNVMVSLVSGGRYTASSIADNVVGRVL